MAVGTNRGVGNVARKVKKQYRGVGNVARQIKKEWRGVANVARQVFSSGLIIFDNGVTEYTFKQGSVNSGGLIYAYGDGCPVQTNEKVDLSKFTKCCVTFSEINTPSASAKYINGIAYFAPNGVVSNNQIHAGFHRLNDRDSNGRITCSIDISEIASTLTNVSVGLKFTAWDSNWLNSSDLSSLHIYKIWLE